MINDLIDFLTKSFRIPRETVATILITLATFILGIVLNLLINALRNYLQRRTHRQLSMINLKLLVKEVHRQARDFDNFKSQLKIEHEGGFTYQYRIIPAVSVFSKIGYETLYNAYFRGPENISILRGKTKLNAFNTLWTSIEYFDHTYNEAFEKAEQFVTENMRLNEKRNESLGKAQEIIERFRIKFNGQLGSKEPLGDFFGKRERIISAYTKEADYSLPHKTEIYIQKLLTLNRDNADLTRRYERDIDAVKLNSLLLECSLRFENMKNHIDSYFHYFDYLSQKYYEHFDRLKKTYRTLNKCEIC